MQGRLVYCPYAQVTFLLQRPIKSQHEILTFGEEKKNMGFGRPTADHTIKQEIIPDVLPSPSI